MKALEFFTTNPGVLVVTMLFIIAAMVLGVFVFILRAQGLSLRPLVWFTGIFLAIVLPQAIFHFHKALNTGTDAPESTEGWWHQDTPEPGNDPDLVRMLGSGAEGAMTTDFAPMLAAAGAAPRWARFVVFQDGSSVVLAAFADSVEASRGVSTWLAMSGLTDYVHGDASQGFSGARPAGDRIFARAIGRHMVIWSAPDFSDLKALVAASAFPAHVHDGMIPEKGDAVIEPPPFGLSWPAALLLLFAYVGVVSVFFTKGAAWASALPPQSRQAVTVDTLRSRLLAVGNQDVPFTVQTRENRDQIEVEWRYADARWIDFMRAHSLQRVHRLVLRLDDASNRVYVSEYQSAMDASAGVDGGRLQWSFSTGIQFMQVEHQRVLGLQLDPSGQPTGALHYAWSFNLQEMKAPLQEVITKSGWSWRPVLLDAPEPLGWLFR
jgi:hypothetical protein